MTLRLDGYVRVSKVGGRSGERLMSPEIQRERIEAWARLRNVEIAAWHVDLDQSGGRLSRPGLDALLERIRASETGGIAVSQLDRLSRASVIDALRLVEHIHDLGGTVAIVDFGADPTTPMGEMVMTVMLALARMARRQLAEGWDAATERAVGRGVHAQVPFGYRKSSGRGSRLEPDPETSMLVPEVFRRRAAGSSWAALAAWLNGQAPTRSGARWARRSVENLVHNRAYLGEARYGRHVNVDAHEALVGPNLFDTANQARAPRPPRGEPALLSGLVRCAGCRHRMRPSTSGERQQRVYRCVGHYGAGDCPAPASVTRALLDEHVERLFLERYGDVELAGHASDPDLTEAVQRVADAEAELAAYRDNEKARAALECLGDDYFAEGLSHRVKAVVSAREALAAARQAAVRLDLGPATALWPDLSVQEKRRLLVEGVDAVFLKRAKVRGRNTGLDPERVRIFWRGESPADLPGPGVRVELRGLDW